ncbi:hypothetical protein RB2302 [Rhodopirellula baltica SH 1]|uniref:Uncharacterized protein n=1 Tax=Rhodopirellula baltica (strain DSM 10527 / NCIMB 13988 / SH1) TaxID=243090 RepID=Q7UW30_RHOBA|nr:hypothetical protein RB2302 [Rhodopirellula baltica SH 1]
MFRYAENWFPAEPEHTFVLLTHPTLFPPLQCPDIADPIHRLALHAI